MGGRISECSRSSAKTTARIFPHFLLFLLWITDSYLNSPRNLHQMEMEKNVLEKKESHNDFYLHNGTERKHLGFGTGAIYSTLTSNPDRKNKPPNGRLDRRCMIFLCLLLSGDIQLNPGPVFKSFTSEKHFVDRHQPDLIQRVKMVDPILDLLHADDVITDEGYSNVRSKSTTQEKMRELYPLLNSSKAKDMFYKGLEVHEKLLLNDIRDAQPSHPTQPERAAASSVSGEVGGRMDSDAVPKKKRKKNEAPPEFDDDYLREAEKNLTKEERESRRLESLALKEKGNGRFKAAEHREAERSYTEALGVCPVCFSSDRAVLFSNRAAARVHLDLKDQAIADCSRAVELNPDYMRAILRRAELYEKTDKLDEALRDYKTVLEKEPGQNAAREACMRLPRQIHDRDEKLDSSEPRGSVHAINEAHDGGIVVAPVISGANIGGSVNITVNTTHQALTGEDEARRDKASKLKDLALKTQEDTKLIEFYRNKLQMNVEEPFTCLPEGSVKRTDKEDFEVCYTHVSIIHMDDTEISCEHEVRQMERNTWQEIQQSEMVMKKARQEIQLSDIFKHPSGKNKCIRTVMSIGNAGVGKTFLIHKFVSDWAKKKHQTPHLTFVFQFRHLNLLQGRRFSLAQLIHEGIDATKCIPEEALNDIFTKLQKSGNSNYDNSLFKLLFVFDGLDENVLPLHFEDKPKSNHEYSDDFFRPVPLEELLVNLMKGKLLRCAHIWITTRPAAAKKIPSQFVDMLMEVKGFTDAKKEEYFRKRFRKKLSDEKDDEKDDEELASIIVSHLKTSKNLHIMCEIPVFCSMAANVLYNLLKTDKKKDQLLKIDEKKVQLPKTINEIYCYFLMDQTNRKKLKYDETYEVDQQQLMETDRVVLLKLGRLAFEHLEKGSIIFYQEDLEVCGLDVKDASLYSGVCTEIFKGERVLFQKKVYCFVHLSLQEFLAAVYLFHCFTEKNMKVLKTFLGGEGEDMTLDVFLAKAMYKALMSENGHLDLFVRFLHGLTRESNQRLLGGLLGQTENSPEIIQRAINKLREMNNPWASPDRFINIVQCLMELNYHSVHEEILQYLKSGDRSKTERSPTECSALAFMLQMSEEVVDELYVDTYNTSYEGRRRLLPAVRNSRKARLVGFDRYQQLEHAHYEVVASALSSNPSHLTELDLSGNKLQDSFTEMLKVKRPHRTDSFIELLSAGLKSPHCRLQILRLVGCNITKTGFEVLASALSSNPFHIKELDLSYNNLQESSLLEHLCAALKSPLCKLETLRLVGCIITQTGSEVLASALTSNLVHLKQLDLSFNCLQDSGLNLLSAGLKSPHCILQILSLSGCEVTEEGCTSLASALTFNPSHLKQLELNFNHTGVKGPESPTASNDKSSYSRVRQQRPGSPAPNYVSMKSDRSRGGLFDFRVQHYTTDLSVNHGGEHWIKPQLLTRYFHRLTLDTNTANSTLSLSENNTKIEWVGRRVQYPYHSDRFDTLPQVLCTEGLTRRCYWEVEWRGGVDIGVTYRGMNRQGNGGDARLGENDMSWSLYCDSIYDDSYTARHNGRKTVLPVHPSGSNRVSVDHSGTKVSRVAVYVDWPAGTLSFYRVSSDTPVHLPEHIH